MTNENGPDVTNENGQNQAYTNQQAQQTPPPPGFVPPPMQPYPPKSRVAAGVLGILLGTLGVHNFYLGYTGKAVAQLLISVLTCGIGTPISGIWGLVEGIMILTGSIAVDGKGYPLAN